MSDEKVTLTSVEFNEWRNPKKKKYYEYMLSYSPYDNVEAKNYPNTFFFNDVPDTQI